MAEVGSAYVSLIPSAKGFAAATSKQLDKPLESAGQSGGSKLTSKLGSVLKKGSLAVGAAAGGVLGTALFKGFERLSAIDEARAKLTGLGNSTKQVDQIMDDALASVKGTAFGLGDAATVAASAVAAGIKPGKDLQRTLSLTGDAATIAGVSISEMGAVFNKVATANKIQGDVINQLNDAGIPIIQLLGKEMGKTAAEVTDLASKGKIDFKTFQNAMEEGLGGAALKSGNTFKGAFANMNAALGRFGAALLSGVFPLAKKVFGGITELLDKLTAKAGPVADAIAEKLPVAFEKVGKAIKSLTSGSGGSLQPLIQAFKDFASDVVDAAVKVGPKLKDLATDLAPLAKAALTAAIVALTATFTALGPAVSVAADAFNVLATAMGPLASLAGQLASGFNSLGGSSQTLIVFGAAVAALSSNLFGLRQRASEAILNLRTMPDATLRANAGAVALKGGAIAAAAGLAALSSASGGAQTELGLLSSVGASVAAGFAVGGPWGAAIGAGAGLLSVFSSRSAAATAAQQKFDSAGKQVAATLNQQTGALTATTRATVAKTLADNGAFTAAQKVGVSYKDVTDAALGNKAATERVDSAVKQYIKTQDGNFSAHVKAAGVAATLTKAVHGTSDAIADERVKIDQVNAAMGRGKDKTVTYTVRTPGLGGALAGLAALGSQIDAVIAKQGRVNGVGQNARGTDNWRGGLTWVGERGPELLNLPRGSQIIPNHKTKGVSPAGVAGGASADDIAAAVASAMDGLSITVVDNGVMANEFAGRIYADQARRL